jgi:acyl carrier protein
LFSRRLVPQLRAFAHTKLPEYMVPSAFVVLEKLPLTRHGKVNHAALPRPEFGSTVEPGRNLEPRNAVERVLVAIWKDVLGLERVSVHADFFQDLGGHSLLATQMVSRLRDSFQMEFPLRRTFEAPTVAKLASALAAESGDAARLERTAELLLRLSQLSDEEVEQELEADLETERERT